MAASTRPRTRTLLRRAHLIAAVPLMAYVYGPADVAQRLELPLRAVVLPLVVISGIVMWQLPALRRAAARRR